MTDQYDIVIIGSGLSGLACGYILSKAGYSVAVLEQNKQVGGCLQTYVRDRRIFDVGVHYIGGLAPGQALHQYFTYFGIMDQLKLEQLDEGAFDKIRLGDGVDYPLAQGKERFIEELAQHFPNQRRALRRYYQAVEDMCSLFPYYNLDIKTPYPTTYEHLSINARDHIAKLIDDPTLRAVLAGNNLLYAGRGETTPFYVHALVLNSYIQSAWRCVDGGSQIARALVRNIRKQGGTILKQREVDRFAFQDSQICGVELTNGQYIGAKQVIHSGHPAQLRRFVRAREHKLRNAYLNRIDAIPPTPAIFSVHYTLKNNTVPYLNHNYFCSRTAKVWEAYERVHDDSPFAYMALTPRSSKSAHYADSFAALAYMDAQQVDAWKGSFNRVAQEAERGAGYEAFKAEQGERLLGELYQQFPFLKGNVLKTYAATPLSFRDYLGTPTGSYYGFERDCTRPMYSNFSTKTRISNLYLTGQNINMHGILGVTVSAVLTCFNFVNQQQLMRDIVAAT